MLGQQPMLSYVTQRVSGSYQHLCSTHSNFSSTIRSMGLGLHGLAAGLTNGSWSPSTAQGMQHNVQHHSTSSAATAPGHLIPAPNRGSIEASCRSGDWLPLESALYAANVVLGRPGVGAAEQQVQQLVQCAAAAVTHQGGKRGHILGFILVSWPLLLPAITITVCLAFVQVV